MEEQALPKPQNKHSTLSTLHLKFVAVTVIIAFISIGCYLVVTNQKTTSSRFIPLPTSQIKAGLPSEVNDTAIFYVSNDSKLYKLSPLLSSPSILIDKVDSYAFSPDKKRIAYTKGYGPETTLNNGIYIKNLENGSDKLMIKSEQGTNRGIQWSPNGAYLLVDAGTGPEGSMAVYDSATGKEYSAFGDGHLVWIDEKTIFITTRMEVSPSRPWGSGYGTGIARIDVVSGNTTIIAKADGKTDYGPSSIKDTCLIYYKTQVNNQGEWTGSAKPEQTSNYCYDLVTGTSRALMDTELEKDDLTKLENAIYEVIPEYKTDKSSQVYRNSAIKDWAVVWVYKGNSIYNGDIVIFNINDPKGTYQKLATGGQVSWF